MAKIYAMQCDPEWFRYEDYYDEDMAAEDGIWAGGNRQFGDTNEDLRKDIVRKLDDAYYDAYEVDDPDNTPEEVIRYYFTKNSKEALTDLEVAELSNLVRTFHSCSSRDENDIICQVLTITNGKTYECGTIHGCCQGDWMEIIYPEERKAMINWIEAVWFATGTEFRITCDSYDEEPDLSEVDVYHDYTELWKPEDIKAWIAENNHVSPEDVVIKVISGTHHITTYDYKEI